MWHGCQTDIDKARSVALIQQRTGVVTRPSVSVESVGSRGHGVVERAHQRRNYKEREGGKMKKRNKAQSEHTTERHSQTPKNGAWQLQLLQCDAVTDDGVGNSP